MEQLAEDRLCAQLDALGPPPQICSIIGLYNATGADMPAFQAAIRFIVRRCGVSVFLIEQETCFTPFIRALQGLISEDSHIKIHVVTRYREDEARDWDALAAQYVPPFHKLENIDPHTEVIRASVLRTERAMIDRADIVLCKLNDSTDSASIRRHIQKRRLSKVIGLGPAADVFF